MPSTPASNSSLRAESVPHDAGQVPQRVRRGCRHDVARGADQVERRDAGIRGQDGADDGGTDRCLGAADELAAPRHPLVRREAAGVGHERRVRHLGEVRALRPKAVGDPGVLLELGEGGGGQGPPGARREAGRRFGVAVGRMRLVRGCVGMAAEEGGVDRLPPQAAADTGQPGGGDVDVHVAVPEAGGREGVRVEVRLGHRDGPHLGVRVREAGQDVRLPDQVGTQRSDRLRQDVVGVEPRVDREPLAELGAVDAPVVAELSARRCVSHGADAMTDTSRAQGVRPTRV